MKTYKDYIKEETDENGKLWHWIEQPFFKPSDFKEAIEENYTHRLKFVTKNELSLENEIEFIKEEIIDLKTFIKPKPTYDYSKLCFAEKSTGDCWFSVETIKEFQRYFEEYSSYKRKEFKNHYLKNRLSLLQEKQHSKEIKSDEVKKELHTDIFKYNAFEVFEIYKENKQIGLNSRTDLRVIFELLKKDKLLVETIELKHYINWLNRVYFMGGITELKKQDLKSTPNIKRTNDYNEYKSRILKQP